MTIGSITNRDGGLCLKSEAGKQFWGISGFGGPDWQEIPDYLADALRRYEMERLHATPEQMATVERLGLDNPKRTKGNALFAYEEFQGICVFPDGSAKYVDWDDLHP